MQQSEICRNIIMMLCTAKLSHAIAAAASNGLHSTWTDSPDSSQWHDLQQHMAKEQVNWQVASGLSLTVDSEMQARANDGSIETQRAREVQMQSFFNCINASYVPATSGLTVQQAMAGHIEQGSLRPVATLWSSQPGSTTTVVTASSFNRLRQLYEQCKSWPGPLSATLYFSVHQANATDWDQDTKTALRAAIMQVSIPM
jgi:hypothetical protein